MWNVAQEFRFALRVIVKAPWFSAVAIATLALGMAANTTVFSWIDTHLRNRIPGIPRPAEIGVMEVKTPQGSVTGNTHPDFRDFQKNMTTVAGVTAMHVAFFTIGPEGETRRTVGQLVSANFFHVLGVRPYLGRLFLSEEDRDDTGAFPLAVISYRLWKDYFGGDPAVVGRNLRVNGRQLIVVGVTPPDFLGTLPGTSLDLWVPLSMNVQLGALNTWASSDWNARFLNVLVRLKPGYQFEQASAEAASISMRLAQEHPDTHRGFRAVVVPVDRSSYGFQETLRKPLLILMLVGSLVLVIACVNVANLLMARSVARQREFSIQMALGAERHRLIRQLLWEVLMLTGCAALVGILMAQWMSESLSYLVPPLESSIRHAVDPVFHPRLSVAVFGATALMVLAATLLSTLMPAWAMGRMDVNEALKRGGRSRSDGAQSHRMRASLVVLEVALASAALIGAGLAVLNFRSLASQNPGFRSENVLIAHFQLSTNGYPLKRERQFDKELAIRLQDAPGIEKVAYGDTLPLSIYAPSSERVQADGALIPRERVLPVIRAAVGPGYFDLMRIPLLDGRDFTVRDDRKAPLVVIVNETFARHYYGTRSPIGHKVRISGELFTIIGVAKDGKYRTPSEPPVPFFYGSFQQIFYSGQHNFFHLRTNGNTDAALRSLRSAVTSLDPHGGLYEVLPLADYVQFSLFADRVVASLLSALGMLSVVLAAIGLFSVMACAVSERTHDIGVHLAMGARPVQVLAQVLGRGLVVTAIGALSGMAAAFAGVRIVCSRLDLNLVAPQLPVYLSVAGFLLLVALVASYVPARRASHVDPMKTLNAE